MKTKPGTWQRRVFEILIALDRWANSAIGRLRGKTYPVETISSRLGRKRVKTALRKGLVAPAEVLTPQGSVRRWETMSAATQKILSAVLISWRHPLSAAIDRLLLDPIDRDHSLEAIGQ